MSRPFRALHVGMIGSVHLAHALDLLDGLGWEQHVDGISQSFLEALLMGSFPIQSDTGCACEWAEDGATALLVPPEEPAAVAAALRRTLTDDALVDGAAARSLEVARRRLERSTIRAKVQGALREVEAEARA